ncbi:MAG: FAD-dependent oxidoreductase [Planctomycetota bacterium]
MPSSRVTVIGAGVVGLSAAVRLAEAGHDVRVVAQQPPESTTSAVAAAIWYPYAVEPKARVDSWAATTYAVFRALAADPDAAVHMRRVQMPWPTPQADPEWRDAVDGFARLTTAERPAGYADGYAFDTPIAEMPDYLHYLVRRLSDLGVTVQIRSVTTLEAAVQDADVAVNCAGLGAAELAGDATVFPIWGQVVRVAGVSLDHATLDERGATGLAYIVPRSRDVVLGGTAEAHVHKTAPEPAVSTAIRARCAALVPALEHAETIEVAAAARPGRPAVRLEAEAVANKTVVHCYGHGGAGMTLSWGCADEVAALVAHAPSPS